jgi:hypothetical protein
MRASIRPSICCCAATQAAEPTQDAQVLFDGHSTCLLSKGGNSILLAWGGGEDWPCTAPDWRSGATVWETG